MSDDTVYGSGQPVFAELRAPSVGGALLGAIIGGIVGGFLWWLVVSITGWSIGLVAIVVGFTVAYGARTLGRDAGPRTALTSAVVAAIAFVVATYFVDRTILIEVLEQDGGVGRVPLFLPFDQAMELMRIAFEPIDILFFAIVVYEAYRLVILHGQQAPEEPEPVWTQPQQRTQDTT